MYSHSILKVTLKLVFMYFVYIYPTFPLPVQNFGLQECVSKAVYFSYTLAHLLKFGVNKTESCNEIHKNIPQGTQDLQDQTMFRNIIINTVFYVCKV